MTEREVIERMKKNMSVEEISKRILNGDPVKIFLTQRQCPGDILTLTAAVRDLKKKYPNITIGLSTSAMSIWDFNPNVDLKMKESEADFVVDCHYPLVHKSNSCGRHFIHGFREHLEEQLGVRFDLTKFGCDIHISDQEKRWMSQVAETGWKGPFWIVNSGIKFDYPAKRWPHENWQEVIDKLNDKVGDKVKFVQVGEKHPDHTHEPLNGVINFIGKTNLRQLIRLAYHAQGSLCHVTMLVHLMSVWNKPCVSVAGGRESKSWEGYLSTRYLDTVGSIHCASHGACWVSKLENCKDLIDGYPRCMRMIKPDDVVSAFMSYYEGGRLKLE